MTKVKYLLSFIAGGLCYSESILLAELFLKIGNWDILKKQVLKKNLLQVRTLKTSVRIMREIISRLALLTEEELSLLAAGTRSEQNLLLWLAICSRYQYIRDFAVEIIHEKFLRMDLDLSQKEYDLFLIQKLNGTKSWKI